MTPQQLIEFAKETRVRVVHDKGTLVVEYEDEYTIRRVIVSSLLVEEDRVVERIAGRTRIYLIPRNRLRQLLNNPVTIRSLERPATAECRQNVIYPNPRIEERLVNT
jgi:hypothetical protein